MSKKFHSRLDAIHDLIWELFGKYDEGSIDRERLMNELTMLSQQFGAAIYILERSSGYFVCERIRLFHHPKLTVHAE